MIPAIACCADCCTTSLGTPPVFRVRSRTAWPDAIVFGLVVAGVLSSGFVVLIQVARALAILRPL